MSTGALLIHIDWYPGPTLRDGGSVHGELYGLDDVAATLQELDSWEDFSGYESEGSLYRGSPVSAVTGGGRVLAWTYIYLGDPDAFPLIPSGR